MMEIVYSVMKRLVATKTLVAEILNGTQLGFDSAFIGVFRETLTATLLLAILLDSIGMKIFQW